MSGHIASHAISSCLGSGGELNSYVVYLLYNQMSTIVLTLLVFQMVNTHTHTYTHTQISIVSTVHSLCIMHMMYIS